MNQNWNFNVIKRVEFEEPQMMDSTAGNIGQLPNVTASELNDLRQKFQLLEGDRKSYYEVSMKKMKENKHSISILRDANKELKNELRQLRKKSAIITPCSDDEIGKLEKHVRLIRRNLDSIKASVETKRRELEKLRDKAMELGVESRSEGSGTIHPSIETTPEVTKQIRALENRLDRSIIKYNEAQSIRKTYEQIVERLKEERDGFDSQIAALEKITHAKEKDISELKSLCGDAMQAKDETGKDLTSIHEKIDRQRKEREKELKRKRQAAEATRQLLESAQEMGRNHAEIFSRVAGDMSKAEEERLRQMNVLTTIQATYEKAQAKEFEKLDAYEIAFAKIMKIAGVQDINDITVKILSQSETRDNLQELINENTKKMESKQNEIDDAKDILESIKFTGIHRAGVTTRKRIDEMEEALSGAKSFLNQRRNLFENASELLLNAQTGIKHLMDKLRVVRPTEFKQFVLCQETLQPALGLCEETLLLLINKSKDAASGGYSTTSLAMKAWQESDISTNEETELLSIMPFNQRVRLKGEHENEIPRHLSLTNGEMHESKSSEEGTSPGDVDDSDCESEADYANDPANPVSRAHIKQVSKIIVRQRSPRSSTQEKTSKSVSEGKRKQQPSKSKKKS